MLSGQLVPAARVLVIPSCVPVSVVRRAARAVSLVCDNTSILVRPSVVVV
jgi:hypothetical protein